MTHDSRVHRVLFRTFNRGRGAKHRGRSLAVATGIALLAACAPNATETEVPVELAERLRATGVNQLGLESLSTAEWVDLAQRGCEARAWEHDAAQSVADDFLDHVDASVDRAIAAQTVWLLTVERCRADVPSDALKRGPP